MAQRETTVRAYLVLDLLSVLGDDDGDAHEVLVQLEEVVVLERAYLGPLLAERAHGGRDGRVGRARGRRGRRRRDGRAEEAGLDLLQLAVLVRLALLLLLLLDDGLVEASPRLLLSLQLQLVVYFHCSVVGFCYIYLKFGEKTTIIYIM